MGFAMGQPKLDVPSFSFHCWLKVPVPVSLTALSLVVSLPVCSRLYVTQAVVLIRIHAYLHVMGVLGGEGVTVPLTTSHVSTSQGSTDPRWTHGVKRYRRNVPG